MQRPAIFSRGNFLVGLLGLRQGMITGQCDHAMQFGIEALKPVKINVGEPDGSELALFHPARQMREWSEGNVFIVGWKRAGISLAPDELVTPWKLFFTGQNRVPQRIREKQWIQWQLSLGRCGAHKAAPWSCASCRRPARAQQVSSAR